MLHFALLVSLFFFFNENETVKNKKRYLLILITLFVLGLLFYIYLSKITKSENFFYMLFGFFNFGYSLSLFVGVLIYILFGYFSFAIFKNIRNAFKYLFIFSFIYSIEVVTYYMQSGLYNHFNIPFASVMISIILALYIYDNHFLNSKKEYFDILKKIFMLILSVLVLLSCGYFYFSKLGKIKFYRIYKDHKIYHWTINKSDFYSTISQDCFFDSLELINKYAKNDNGVYIISKFDMLLTFLTDKYSKMDNFVLAPSLITQKDIEKNINILNRDKPLYVFMDNDLISENFYDPYSIIYDADYNNLERDARIKKYIEMKKIFDSFIQKYELVEQSKLISVFRIKY